MKKIYTLIAALSIFVAANAQNDFAVNLVSHTAGDTDASDPLTFEFEVENVGTSTFLAGDTLWVSLGFDGGVVGLDLTVGNVNGYIVDADFAPGDVFAVPAVTIDWIPQPAGTTVDLCAVVYGFGAASFSGAGPSFGEIIVGDDNTDNNVSCITAELPVDDASIEANELGLTNIYYAAGEIILVSEGSEAGKQVNMNVVSINGQTVQSETFVMSQGMNAVAVNAIASGIYIVAVEIEGVLVTRKISIQ